MPTGGGINMNLPQQVQINDVMLRDGLQLEKQMLTTQEKHNLITRLINANIQTIEFGSFVHPKLVPQMANSGELFQKVSTAENITLISLIPNFIGLKMANENGVKTVNYVFSASDTHNLQNVRKHTGESLAEVDKMQAYCQSNEMTLHVSIATSFGCPFEGEVKVEKVAEIIRELQEQQVDYITLADTTGMANPKQVYERMVLLTDSFPEITFNMHFHNTRGLGLANVLASLQAGITHFDASLGGLGGCPFAPDATGNIATEDLVHLLEVMGVKTNVDLDVLLQASTKLEKYIGHELESSVFKAGKADRRYSIKDI